jgi:hypothetical protein
MALCSFSSIHSNIRYPPPLPPPPSPPTSPLIVWYTFATTTGATTVPNMATGYSGTTGTIYPTYTTVSSSNLNVTGNGSLYAIGNNNTSNTSNFTTNQNGYMSFNSFTVGTNGFSISLWYNISSIKGGWARLFTLSNGTTSKFVSINHVDGSWLAFYVNNVAYDIIDITGTGYIGTSTGTQYGWTKEKDEWHHIACVIDNTQKVTFYLNGNDITNNTANTNLAANRRLSNYNSFPANNLLNTNYTTNFLCTFGSIMNTNSSFTGYIDDFRIYNGTLSQLDVNYLYNYRK